MRPYTLPQLHTLAAHFVQQQLDVTRGTAENVLDDFLGYVEDVEKETIDAQPDPALDLFNASKKAYLDQADPFRGLSKKARAIAKEADAAGLATADHPTRSWQTVLRGWIESGEVFKRPRVTDDDVKELCRLLVTGP